MASIALCFVNLWKLISPPQSKPPATETLIQEEVVTQPVAPEHVLATEQVPQNVIPVTPGPFEAPKPPPVAKLTIETNASPVTETPPATNVPLATKIPPVKVIPEFAPVRKATEDLNSSNIDAGAQQNDPRPSPTVTIPEWSPTGSLATPQLSRRNSAGSCSNLSRGDSERFSKSNLKEQLEDARLDYTLRPHTYIIPRNVQEELITEETIAKDIQARNPAIAECEAKKYAKETIQHAGRLYATLACVKHGADICTLLKEGITDKDLPLVRKQNDRNALYLKDGRRVMALKDWKRKHLEEFDRVQWWMTSPVFKYEKHYRLDEKTVLPFIQRDADDEALGKKQGGYSEVYPVRIHRAHHNFSKCAGLDSEPLVAVKQLFSSDETEFQKESTILRALGPKKHPHLIRLLATYEMGNKYHLMFPYANANLRKYWDDHPKPTFDRKTVLWSLRQMSGLASGLKLIHAFKVTFPLSVPGAGTGDVRLAKGKDIVQLRVEQGEQYYGRHGDIKPENILWFSHDQSGHQPDRDPMGVLQIADFGLGRFHGRDSRSGINPEKILSSPTYEPPECKMLLPVSRVYDIWSLGCIYLEFVTWLLRGSKAITDFSDHRGRLALDTGINDDNFFTITKTEDGTRKVAIREEVKSWSEELHAHENCSQLIHDLLHLTMSWLLVVETEKRIKAHWLCISFEPLLRKAETDPDYLLKPVPRKMPSERSNSSPSTLGTPATNSKRNSVTFLGQEKPNMPKSQFKVHVVENPKDLVLRNLGNPFFEAKNIGKNSTWPLRMDH